MYFGPVELLLALIVPDTAYSIQFQVISKKESRLESKQGQSGRLQDIKIENFDVAFGEK